MEFHAIMRGIKLFNDLRRRKDTTDPTDKTVTFRRAHAAPAKKDLTYVKAVGAAGP